MSTLPAVSPVTDLIPVGQIVRHEFGAQQVERSAETQSTAVAAREQAAIEARYKMALMRRRNVDQFRVDILRECKRPGFAEMAEYHRPVGKEKNRETGEWEEKIATGPSVHLIRTAIALYGNMLVDSATMYESPDNRLVHAYVLDLQNNVSWARTIALSKVVEKRAQQDYKTKKLGPPEGREVISERLNTKGETVYTVYATEDEVRTKEARLLAIAQRENGRSVLPRDIIDEAVRVARETIATADAADPDAARRKLIDAFSEQGVRPENLTEYLGHQLDRITPAELKELRGVFVAIREGESTWDEIMAVKNPVGSKEAAQEVAKQKLANLGAKGSPKQTANKGATEGAKATEPAQPEAASVQGTTSESPAAAAPSPELPVHQASIQQYLAEIGEGPYMRILGSNGYESAADVKEKDWKVVAQDMEDELKIQREERAAKAPGEEPKKQGRLKL